MARVPCAYRRASEVETMARQNKIELLNPLMQPPIRKMQAILIDLYGKKLTDTNFQLFETWRSPVDQLVYKEKGTSKAGPWQSPHQYGLAADFVPFVDGSWSWAQGHDWELLGRVARECGLTRPIGWDLPHVEHPRWATIKQYLIR